MVWNEAKWALMRFFIDPIRTQPRDLTFWKLPKYNPQGPFIVCLILYALMRKTYWQAVSDWGNNQLRIFRWYRLLSISFETVVGIRDRALGSRGFDPGNLGQGPSSWKIKLIPGNLSFFTETLKKLIFLFRKTFLEKFKRIHLWFESL